MASLVLIGIVIVMALTVFAQLFRKKSVKKLLLYYVVILGSYYLYVTYTCSPKSADVKAMKPQAEVIKNYILENGIPGSLGEIPDVPYKLENCKWTEENVEWCYFNISGDRYSTRLYFVAYDNGIDIDVRIHNEKSETGVFTEIEKTSSGTFKVVEHFKPYSTKNDGVCNPMRM